MADGDEFLIKIGSDVKGALAGIEGVGKGIKGMAAKAASAFAAVGLMDFAKQSIDAAEKMQVSNANMASSVLATSGTVVASGTAAAAAAKDQEKLTKAKDALTKLELSAAPKTEKASKNSADAARKSELAHLKLKEAQDKVAAAQTQLNTDMAKAEPAKQPIVTRRLWALVSDTIAQVSDKSAFSKQQVTDAFTTLVAKTGSTTTATKDLGLAADVARRYHMDLAGAGNVLAKVEDGRVSAAARLLPFLDKNMSKEQALAAIRQHTAGASAAYTATAQGQQDKMNNAFEEFQIVIGTKLLPVLTPLVQKVTNLLDMFTKAPGWVQNTVVVVAGFAAALAVVGPWLGTIGGVLSFLGGTVFPLVGGALIPVIAAVWSFTAALLANPITWIVIAIIAVIAAIVLLATHWKQVTAVMGTALLWLRDNVWNPVWNGIKAAFGAVMGLIWWYFDTFYVKPFQLGINLVQRAFSAFFSWFGHFWKVAFTDPLNEALSIIGKVTGAIGSVTGGIGNAVGNVGHLLGFADGGVVSGPSSGYPVMLHGTERIMPVSSSSAPRPTKLSGAAGGHSVVINITGSKADAQPIAEKVEPVVQRILRGTGAPVMDFGG